MAAHPRKHRPPRAGRALLLAAILLAVFLWWDNTSLQVTEADPSFSDLPADQRDIQGMYIDAVV